MANVQQPEMRRSGETATTQQRQDDPHQTQPSHGQHDKTGDRPVPPDQESPYGPASRDATD